MPYPHPSIEVDRYVYCVRMGSGCDVVEFVPKKRPSVLAVEGRYGSRDNATAQ